MPYQQNSRDLVKSRTMPIHLGAVQTPVLVLAFHDSLHAFATTQGMVSSNDALILQQALTKTLFIAGAMHQIQTVKRVQAFSNERPST